MKRLFIALLLGTLFFISESFTPAPNVNVTILRSFKSNFTNATNVSWKIVGDYYRASFNEENEALNAYFSEDGELVATSKFISINDLPFLLRKELRKYNSTILEIFEVDSKEDIRYYATIQDENSKTILQSLTGCWSVYKKDKKQ